MKSKKQDEKFDLSFARWIDHFSKEPTSDELDEMENEVKKNTAQNNPYYHPMQGA